MTKGTYSAGIPLKPTELKVGDYYSKYIDDMIKRNDAKKAEYAKMLQEQRKAVGERFKDMKIDPYSTIANFQDFANKQLVDTAKYIGEQRMLAENDLKNSHIYIQRAENAWNDYRTMASSFGSKDFIEKANAKQQALANNDVFSDTDNNERLRMLGYAIPITERDENGRLIFKMPKDGNATDDDELGSYSVGEVMATFTSPDEINLLRSNKSNGNNGFLDKQSYDVAKVMADEYSRNTDGNVTNAGEWFSKERGSQWFDSTFGTFNINNIPTVVSQYSRQVLKKKIETEEDFAAAKQGIINHISSLVPTMTERDTKYTAADLEAKRLGNIEKGLDIAKKQAERMAGYPSLRNSGGGGGGGRGSTGMTNGSTAGLSYSSANQNVFVQTKVNNNGKSVTVVKQQPMRILTLPKLKGQPATDNVFGVTRYRNKKGAIVNAYYVGTPAEDGRITTSRVDGKELDSYFVKLGYNPMVAKQYLFEQTNDPTNSDVPYIGTQTGKWYNIPRYAKPVFFKTKEAKDEEESY